MVSFWLELWLKVKVQARVWWNLVQMRIFVKKKSFIYRKSWFYLRKSSWQTLKQHLNYYCSWWCVLIPASCTKKIKCVSAGRLWMSSVQAVEGDNGVREHVHASNTLMSDGGRRSRAEARIRAGVFMKTLHRHRVNEWEAWMKVERARLCDVTLISDWKGK